MQHLRLRGRDRTESVDEIQRSLRASLEAGPGESAREAFFLNLPKDPDALSFWLLIAVRLSQQEPWWYDTLAALVRRYLGSREWREKRELPGVLVAWCAGCGGRGDQAPRGGGVGPRSICWLQP